jgi:CRISPR system Cascade subunit CasB
MQPEKETDRPSLDQVVSKIGNALANLDPGPLAELRRMSLAGDAPGAAYFWRLASRYDFGGGDRLHTWARVVQLMAILTDKGASDGKQSPHEPSRKENHWRGLGHTFCDGGDQTWGNGQTSPRPMLSEQRFARLLAAKGQARFELMERAIRALAAKKSPGVGVNCADLARFLLDPDNPSHARKLARDYYARLDRASEIHTETTNSTGANA